jgi:hypothetical protein
MQSQKNNGFQEGPRVISPSSNGWGRFDYLTGHTHKCAKKKVA